LRTESTRRSIGLAIKLIGDRDESAGHVARPSGVLAG
jgi:hypothetical protein